MIAVIDYGAGNLKNVAKALDFLGFPSVVTSDAEVIAKADKLILPGVGAFGDAMRSLTESGLDALIKNVVSSGKPLLGICLGMQLLFDESEESPGVKGLSLLPGKIRRLPQIDNLKIPHMGWNDLIYCRGTLFEGLSNPYVYFVHSYYLDAADKADVAAKTHYGIDVEVAVEHKNIFATQFHPEKSGAEGLKILANFAKAEVE
ncbi:MAG: imidazole glycerol phosphate synthase subunit HisH [Clostridia bacterium]|nr:imidazole glycerol phosphate synthase subunit HisH [Clostridia bacterium]